ncbi:hypothetical protein MUN78_05010 [Leucobacter allii]|uniref:Bacitracin resistance protein n=1 Tax=Leucobacter allii TaxID=2932247 RepID=A0ABY4FPK4_9MICO|nr:hypothetical protein [Leucobacter allii]UOQ58208.1 hypothetical protein MUN78_05010 [Leucobacter allii]UOR02790.1 hypothetical protein MUN77_05625 [Leucobacter allii]
MIRTVTVWIIGILLAGLYVYAAIAGVGNFIGMHGLGAALGTGLSASGWVWLMLGIALPIALLAAALLLGRRRSSGFRLLLLAAGIAVLGALQIDIMHLVPESTYFAA